MAAKKAYSIVPDNVCLLLPEAFLSNYDGEMVKTFVNTLDMYFHLTGITDDNTQALVAKTWLNSLAQIWYES